MRHQNRQQFRSLFQAKVSNSRNGSLIGYAVDVSESGLKVISESPFVTHERLHMLMQVRENEILQFDLDATCKWSGTSEDTGYFEGGFCLDHPPIAFASMVEALRNHHNEPGQDSLQKISAVSADPYLASMSA